MIPPILKKVEPFTPKGTPVKKKPKQNKQTNKQKTSNSNISWINWYTPFKFSEQHAKWQFLIFFFNNFSNAHFFIIRMCILWIHLPISIICAYSKESVLSIYLLHIYYALFHQMSYYNIATLIFYSFEWKWKLTYSWKKKPYIIIPILSIVSNSKIVNYICQMLC